MMAYQLTLTQSEKNAFDWVGDRYVSSGHYVKNLLLQCMSPDDEWDNDTYSDFDIPEHIAWQINDAARDEDYLFPCFCDSLPEKMLNFCYQIV